MRLACTQANHPTGRTPSGWAGTVLYRFKPSLVLTALRQTHSSLLRTVAIYCATLVLVAFPRLVEGQAQPNGPAAAPVRARTITTSDGLPHQTIYSLAQDTAGYLWLGCPTGLYRYDGVEFTRFGSSLARHDEVHDLQLAGNGTLYAANFRGQLFRVSADSLREVADIGSDGTSRLSYLAMQDSLMICDGRRVFARRLVADTSTGRLVRNAESPGLVTILPRGPKHFALAEANELRYPQVPGLTRSNSYFLLSAWTGPSSGLNVYAPGFTFEQKGPPELFLVPYNDRGEVGAIQRLPWRTNRASDQPFFVQPLSPDSWLASGRFGLGRLSRESVGEATWQMLLPNVMVTSCLIDAQGIVWVGTARSGLMALPGLQVTQQRYELDGTISDLAFAANGTDVYGMSDQGSVYRLTGQAAVDLKFRTRDQIRFWANARAPRQEVQTGLYVGINPVPPPGQLGVYRDARIAQVKSGLALPNGRYAFATANLAALIEPASLQETVIAPGRAFSVAYQQSGDRLWLASASGLHSFHSTGEETSQLVLPKGSWPTALASTATDVYVGTSSGRLYVLVTEPARDQVRALSGYRRWGQIEELIARGDTLWVRSVAGLTRCTDLASGGNCERFGPRLDFPPTPPTALAVAPGRIAVAYGNRVLYAPSSLAARSPGTNQIHFSQIQIAGRAPTGQDSILQVRADEESLELEPRQRGFRRDPSLPYRYRLLPLDTTWRSTSGARPSIYFASLPAGTYDLQLTDPTGAGADKQVRIKVTLPWWRRPWVWVLATLLAAAVIGLRLRQNLLRKQIERQRESELRISQLNTLAAQMNPHFLFNTLNSVQDFVLRNDRLAANAFLAKFAHLMRLTLDHSQRSSITLAEELDTMRTYLDLERIRFDDEVKIELLADEDLPLSAQLPTLLVQPYAENALRHGLLHQTSGLRQLRVHYTLATINLLRVYVEDTGIGRAAAIALREDASHVKHQSFAMDATARRLELLAAQAEDAVGIHIDDLTDHTGAPSGTRVIITIQLQSA